jgi:hypothetical protein
MVMTTRNNYRDAAARMMPGRVGPTNRQQQQQAEFQARRPLAQGLARQERADASAFGVQPRFDSRYTGQAVAQWQRDTGQMPGYGPQPFGQLPAGGGTRGVGVGGGAAAPDMSGYNAAILKLLASDMFNARGNPELEAMIDPAVQQDIAATNKAFGGIPAWGANSYLTAQQTPTPRLDPDMAKLLAANGVPLDEYQATVGAANQGIGAADANWANHFTSMGAAQTADREMADRTNASQREVINSSFTAMGRQMKAALAARKAEEQKQLAMQKMQVILQLISANQGMPGGIDFGGLL